MFATIFTWSCLASACACAQLPPTGDAVPAPSAATARTFTTEQLDKLIEQLGDDRIAARDQASQDLWEAGLAAEAHLREAATSPDAEVRLRAKAVLDKFRAGIFVDTPPETIAFIQQFRGGTVERRTYVLQKLAEKRDYQTLFRLVNSITDAEQRKRLLERVQSESNNVIRQLIQQGNLAEAERILEFGSEDDAGLLTLVAFCRAAGTLDARLARTRQRYDTKRNLPDAKQLIYLYRAKGDLDAAYEISRAENEPLYQRSLLLEAGRWKEMAEVQKGIGVQPPQRLSIVGPQGNVLVERIETLGYQFAAARRAGATQEAEALLEELKTFANVQRDNAPLVWNVAEALFISDSIEQGIEWSKTSQPGYAFELLVYQHRYREAFDFVGLKEGRAISTEWLDSLPASPGAASQQRIQRFRLAITVARTLHTLGKKKEVAEIVAVLDRVAQDAAAKDKQNGGRADLLMSLAQLEFRLGMLEPAFAHADQASGEGDVENTMLRTFFGNRSEEAVAWSQLFRKIDPQTSFSKLLPRIYRVMQFPVPADSTVEEFEKFVEPALEHAQTIAQSDMRGRFLDSLASSMLVRNYAAPARRLLDNSATYFAGSSVRLGDLEAEQKNWPEAARRYADAARLDPQQLPALYLAGLATEKAGDATKGQELMRQARLSAHGSRNRHALGQFLHARGHLEHAGELLEFAIATSPFEHWETNDAARILAEVYAERRPAQAARLWDRHLLADLRTTFFFLEVENYVRFPFMIHKANAQAAIDEKKFDVVAREIEIASKTSPNDVRLAEDLVPLLEKADQKELAQQLFDRSYASLAKVIEVYPESAFHRNNLAWLSARCRRQLDQALAHAQEAVRLQPENPSYLDTLAEVHFQRGDREQAIRWSQAAVKLSPRYKAFQDQLARFQTAPLSP